MEYIGRCRHGRVGLDGCDICEEDRMWRRAFENYIRDEFGPGVEWDDLTAEEQDEAERYVMKMLG